MCAPLRISALLPDTRVIAYTYDPDGNVTSVTPPGRPSHGFDYDAIDQTTGYTPPALDGGPVATHYDYNLDKQPTKVTRPDGQTIDYAYDAAGRLSTLTMPTGAISYAYKAGSGQLASIAAPDGVNLAYTYDGALLTGVTATGPIPGALTTVYDNFFRASQIGVNGSNIAYAYDADGLLTGAGNMALARDPGNGLVTGTALGQIATTQSYDSFGRVSGFTAKQGATVLFDEQYQRDNAGNLTKKTVTMVGQTSVYNYAYDPAGRLTDVTKDGTATGHFEYDANGNRILAYGTIASYDDQDRLTGFGNAQYAYTANGELQKITGATTASYEYDVSGNLKHVDLPNGSTLDYLADGRNRRVGKKVNGTLVQGFLYQDQLKPAAELNGQGNVISRFVYAGKANVPDYMVKGGVTYRIVSDQLGSVRLVINSATGQIAQRIDYDEWGNVLSDSNPGFQPFGFAGGLYDRDTGLVRFGARDYDPHVGRWTVKDPIGFGGGDTGLYGYVGGNPISYTDPNGLTPVGIAVGIGVRVIGGRAAAAIGAGARSLLGPTVGGIAACVLAGVCTLSDGNDAIEPKPNREQKPEGCPVGTKPIDKDKRLDRKKIHGIKDQIGAGARDWVGISPDGRIWTNEGGQAANNGPFEDYLP